MRIKELSHILSTAQHSSAVRLELPFLSDDNALQSERSIAISRVAVDACAVLHFLASEDNPAFISALLNSPPPERSLASLLLPDYPRFQLILETFVEMMQSAGLELVWYFDGPVSLVQGQRQDDSLRELSAQIDECVSIYDHIESTSFSSSSDSH